MLQKKHRFLAILASFAVLTSLFPANMVSAAGTDQVNIQVAQDDLLDVVLTTGKTDSNVSTFGTDLTAALVNLGVPEDKIKIQAVEANEVSAGDTTAGWEIYDHTNTSSKAISYYRPYYQEVNSNYTLDNHITVSTSGQTNIDFYGYGAPSYRDFMYMPNTDSGKKTLEFTIQEGSFYDALNGAGYFFNTKMSSNTDLANRTMSGYLLFFNYPNSANPATVYIYKFTNVNVNDFHNSTSYTVTNYPGFTQIASFAAGSNSSRKVKIEATADELQMWYNDSLVNWTLTGGTTSQTITLPTDFGEYGFGPMVGYLNHGCAQHTHFTFYNVTMSTESTKRFSEVIREPEWRENSKRFLINAQDTAVADFSDATALGEILTRLGNEGIYYLGWGKAATDGNAFIAKNDGKGTYVDKTVAATDTYTEQVNALANYIYAQYHASVQNDTDMLIYGNPNSISISPESEKTNTIDANWPSGKWRVDHNPNYYENSTGTALYDNIYLNNLDISFVETGKYDIYYKDELVKTVYVHRAPVAGFSVSVDAGYNVTITDQAYDLDHQSQTDKGIVSESYAYRETSSSTWISGAPTTLSANKEYVIRQIVTDEEGVEGTPYYRYVSTSSVSTSKPVASFTMTPGRLLTYQSEDVSYNDVSYDPQGGTITATTWTVTLGTTQIYSGSTPKTSFSGAAAGTYKISLLVKNNLNVWSEEVSRYLVVVRDTTAPSVTSNLSSGTYNTAKVAQITVADETDGSGFASRYSVVDNSSSTPSNWGSIGTNSVFNISLSTLGTWYVHVKGTDYAGNTKTATFGPYTISDNTAPTTPTLGTSPAYTNGSWTPNATTISASGSTDDFTADANLVYAYSVNSGTYTTGRSVTLSNEGTYTVSFRVTDASGNTSTIATQAVKIDYSNPTTPTLAATENGSAYTLGTWATHNVSFSLSGSTDSASGVASYEYRINNGSWTTGASGSLTASGLYTVEYRSVDGAGNRSSSGTASIKVDKVAPSAPAVNSTVTYTDNTWSLQSITLQASGSTDDMTASGDLVYAYSVDSGSYTNGNSVTISSDGTHQVSFRTTDAAGNVSTVTTRTILVDRTNPTFPTYSATSNGSGYSSGSWATHSVTFTLSGASDATSTLSGYEYKIDSGSWTSGSTATITAQGKHTVQYRSVDVAGNRSSTGTSDIWIDLEAPTVVNVEATPTYTSGQWSNVPVTLEASGSSDNFTQAEDLQYTYKVNGGAETSGKVVTFDTNGTYTVVFKVTDDAGLVSDTVTWIVKIDQTNPSVPAYLATVGSDSYTAGTWSLSPVTFTLSGATDQGGSGLSGYEYKLNNGSWTSGSHATITETGKYVVWYRSVDCAGNRSLAANNVIWVDVGAPTAPSVTSSPAYTDGTWTNGTVTFTAADSADDYTAADHLVYQVSTDGVHYTTGTVAGFSSDGTHTAYFRTIDEAGNISDVTSRTVKLDSTNPEIPDLAATTESGSYDPETWATTDVTVTLSGADDEGGSGLAGYEYKINGGDWTTGDEIVFDESGIYEITYRAFDHSGNRSESVSYTVKVDIDKPVKPTITISADDGTTLNFVDTFDPSFYFGNGTVIVTINTEDAMSGVNKLYWSLGEGKEQESIASDHVTFRIPVEYRDRISAYSVDDAGLASDTATTPTIVLENTKPVLTTRYDPTKDADAMHVDLLLQDLGSGIAAYTYKIGSADSVSVNVKDGSTAPTNQKLIGLDIPYAGMKASDFLLTVTITDLSGNLITFDKDLLPIILSEKTKETKLPNDMTEEEKKDCEQQIKDLYRLYMLLNKDGRTNLGQTTLDRMNAIMNQYASMLELISKDAATGISSDRLGTSLLIPELAKEDVSKVKIEIKTDVIPDANKPTFMVTAASTLADNKSTILTAYDIYLMKTVYTAEGDTTSKVQNSDITGYMTIRIPVTDAEAARSGLRVVHVADDGTITDMNAILVTVDGQKYLEFQTNHFSAYAIVGDVKKATVKTGETESLIGYAAILATISAGSVVSVKIRRRMRK